VFEVAPGVAANDIAGMTRGGIRVLGKFLAGCAIAVTLGAMPEAVAQQAVAQCTVIQDDGERLACYDAIFLRKSTTPDQEIVVASERLIPARPTGREPAMMSIGCENGEMVVSFAFAGQLVSNTGDIAPLTYQVDAGGTTVRTLRADTDNIRLSFADQRDTQTFLDSLIGGTNLKVRVTPVRQRSLTVDFRLATVAEELSAMRESCDAS
jgi:hypothetical protein